MKIILGLQKALRVRANASKVNFVNSSDRDKSRRTNKRGRDLHISGLRGRITVRTSTTSSLQRIWRNFTIGPNVNCKTFAAYFSGTEKLARS